MIFLSSLIFLPFIGSAFVALSHGSGRADTKNAFYVTMLTLSAVLGLILCAFQMIQIPNHSLNLVEFPWPILPDISLYFGVDELSLLLMSAVNLAIFIGTVGIRLRPFGRKNIYLFSLIFSGIMNGYLMARDLFSFGIFFTLSFIPLMMQCGFGGMNRKGEGMTRFFVFNMIGVFLWLLAMVYLYASDSGSQGAREIFVSGVTDSNVGIFLISACFFRIPVWPLYKFIVPILKNVHNSLVFINLNLLPMTGIYGLIRLLPIESGGHLSLLVRVIGALSLMTMVSATCWCWKRKKPYEKLFEYLLVYNLFYLLAVFIPTNDLKINIVYSLFAFLLLMALLSVLLFHIRAVSAQNSATDGGVLCLLPKTSVIYGFVLLSAIGLPVTSLFWNNFIILSKLFDDNLQIGGIIMLSLTLISASLLNNWYDLKEKSSSPMTVEASSDLDSVQFITYLFIIGVLFLSFINPLWFVVH